MDASAVNLSVASVAHLEHDWFAPSPRASKAGAEALADCFEDVSCVAPGEFPAGRDASRAIAHISYLEFVVEVTDMNTGVRKAYAKDAGGYCGNSDTAAF